MKVLVLSREDVWNLFLAFDAAVGQEALVRVAYDDMTKSFKMKLDNGTWSPPFGELEVDDGQEHHHTRCPVEMRGGACGACAGTGDEYDNEIGDWTYPWAKCPCCHGHGTHID